MYVPSEDPTSLATRRNALSQSVCELGVSCLVSRRYRIHRLDKTYFGSKYELDTDGSDGS